VINQVPRHKGVSYLVLKKAPRHEDVEDRTIAPRILILGTRWRWVVSFTPRPLYPLRKEPPVLIYNTWTIINIVLSHNTAKDRYCCRIKQSFLLSACSYLNHSLPGRFLTLREWNILVCLRIGSWGRYLDLRERSMRWALHVVRMERRYAYNIFVEKQRPPLRRRRSRREDNIKVDLKKMWTGCIWLRIGTDVGLLWTR